ncbi:divalent-cation tolerance protein CutA [Halocatena halophila]|uniref:divalent-cation tolerance protein CutA n=1 Tax=Halocatena halophila TaxID=2814576 RepID=UPI002ED43C52
MPTAYITCPESIAEELAYELVDEGHCACVNLLDCRSVYRWDDSVQTDEEVILLAKTTDENYQPLVEAVCERHPYDIPCIERFEDAPIEPFAAWRKEATN